MAREFSMHNIDPKAFIDALDHAKGKIMLVTDDGDQFNLKSKLSQLAGVLKLIEGGKMLEARIICEDLEDEAMMFRLNLFGHK
jgi:hypothetical protein